MKKSNPSLSKQLTKIMETKFLTVKKDQRVSEVYELLKKKSNLFEVMDYIYVIQNNKEPVGVFSIKDIFRFSLDTKVENFMQTKLVTASINTDIEKIAHIALK